MGDLPLIDLVRDRLEAASVSASDQQVGQLVEYVRLLARWNRRINLTALPIDPPTPASVDRLIVEPLQAAAFVRPADRLALDIGSGGGSPALPIKIAAPALLMTLVESRGRKASFLREAARHLQLAGVSVEQARLEDLIGIEPPRPPFALVSVRAVRLDASMWADVSRLTTSGSRVLWFRSEHDDPVMPAGWTRVHEIALVGGGTNQLAVLDRD